MKYFIQKSFEIYFFNLILYTYYPLGIIYKNLDQKEKQRMNSAYNNTFFFLLYLLFIASMKVAHTF